jgi:MFS family permease
VSAEQGQHRSDDQVDRRHRRALVTGIADAQTCDDRAINALVQRVAEAGGAYRTVFGHPPLRNVQLAYGASITAEWAATVALAVFAYQERGAVGVGIVGVVRMLPAALATPFAAFVSDRFRREHVLLWIELLAAATLAVSAVVFFAGRSEAPIYALAGVLAVFSTLLRPTLAALLPSLARTPRELIAANGASLTTESLGTLVGPILAGVIVSVADPGTVFAVAAGFFLLGAALVQRVHVEGRLDEDVGERRAGDVLGGFRIVAREPHPRLLIALFSAQTLVRGSLNVLIVVLAFRLLHAGGSWVGFLTAALGAGGLVGAFASVALAGRRLAVPFGAGLLLWALPIAALALWPNKASALVLLAVVGVGNSFEDVGGFTLLQRIVRDDVLARVLGVLWGLAMAGVGIGSVLAPPLIHAVGSRGAAAATGLFLALLVLLAWPRLLSIDRSAAAPVRELAVLERVPMFEGLSVAAKERVASRLVPLDVPAGTEIVREGEVGDRFYIVVDGELDVVEGGRPAGRGSPEYFGEIALLRDVPRTATVAARTPVSLFALDREDFIAAVTGYSGGREAGEAVVAERLAIP